MRGDPGPLSQAVRDHGFQQGEPVAIAQVKRGLGDARGMCHRLHARAIEADAKEALPGSVENPPVDLLDLRA
ncbi:MAG: hypothetical protein NVS3B27_09680 [Novosphingobium sp.]